METLTLQHPSVPRLRCHPLKEMTELLQEPAETLEAMIDKLSQPGKSSLPEGVTALPVIHSPGPGYHYAHGPRMVAHVRLGFTRARHWVIETRILDGFSDPISHFYHADGTFAFSQVSTPIDLIELPKTVFEPNFPILNGLYQWAALEYLKTRSGLADTQAIHTVERILRRIEKLHPQALSYSRGARDPAILRLNSKLISIEKDPVYHWREKQDLFRQIKSERKMLMATKRRVHGARWSPIAFLLLAVQDGKGFCERLRIRPLSNGVGFLDSLLLDPLRWFIGVVRNNLGYSIALAIYSPFTFFFITQPMNPHAMRAVGTVRSATLELVESIGKWLTPPSTGATRFTQSPLRSKSDYTRIQPAHSDMLVSTDVPEVAHQTWDQRMSNFKAMQIAYESNLEIAPRMGRLEQMETQLSWPLILESAWFETERYSRFLNFILMNETSYAPELIRLVRSEQLRLDQVQLYLWDRSIRFILDHPYIVMNESQEQPHPNFYSGRPFILLREMTRTLNSRHPGIALPPGYDRILEIARKSGASDTPSGSILDRLKQHEPLLAASEANPSDALRSQLKREWEVLYLQQNHAQEASNSGLQLYVWSVRNVIAILQSYYSAKREELSLISIAFKKDQKMKTPSIQLTQAPSFQQGSAQYEDLLHLLKLEFASIQKEIGDSLPEDIEAIQRKKIIEGIENFLKEREALLRNSKLI